MSDIDKWHNLDSSLLYPESGMPIYENNTTFLATRNSNNQYMLAARIAFDRELEDLPVLKGISLNLDPDGSNQGILSLTLDESSVDLDIFSIFCKELADKTIGLEGAELINECIQIIKRWSDWFSAVSDGFSNIKMIGLLGEMYALNNYVIPMLGDELSIRAWLGPEGAQQDIVAEKFSIEVKAHHAGFNDKIHISSVGQLDSVMTEKFYLFKVDFAPSQDPSSYSLTSLHEKISSQLSEHPSALEKFNDKYTLLTAGAPNGKLTKKFSLVSEAIYEVTEAFPMISSDDIAEAIIKSTIEYAIDVSQIKDFLIDKTLGEVIDDTR
ncbi:PD-(D/E)XK motif protein [Gammaproteobacteria bacterium]|nr:PD-(D/E)XK motif protein [Gammaproteobacteria bacterium]